MRMNLPELWSLDRRGLAATLSSGFPIEIERLRGASYRGVSLGLPALVERATWKTFRKQMFPGSPGSPLLGHNVRLVQSDRLEPIRKGDPRAPVMQRGGRDWTFGPFRAVELPRDRYPCRGGVLLDYGAEHPVYHPLSRLRDPVVALVEGSTELLFGASYLDVFGRVIATPSFFTLELED